MRPRGEERVLIAQAAARIVLERARSQQPAGATWRELAAATQVGFSKAKEVTKNMAAAGELEVVGDCRVPGICRPMRLYAPRRPRAERAALGDIVRGWVKG